MTHRISARPDVETPIERIFEKVMHRKLTVAERKALHLKAVGGTPYREIHPRRRLAFQVGSKLTSL